MTSADEQLKKDEFYMRKALQEAEAARREGEVPIGAVVVAGERVVSRAHNLTETLHDVTAHGADGPDCVWSSRREAWLSSFRASRVAPQGTGYARNPRR